ncbi:MAG: leucine--tRNA ligase [Thermoplasmata archaeon]
MNTTIEKKWQTLWKENHIFEPEKKGDKFFITVPYPYANGPLHIGHGRAYTYGDVIARFKRMEGYNVLFPMAFHVTGTPILAIADSIKNGNQEMIDLYRSYLKLYENDEKKIDKIIEEFKDPEKIALYFSEKIQKDFESIGYSIDWRKKFHTAETYYNKFVIWQYKKLYEMGYLKKGDYPITFSIVDGNPVGEDDIKDGDTDKVSILEYMAIKFDFEDGYILAGTLRPETIFGVTNIWVNPEGEYVKAKYLDQYFFVSKEAYEKLRYQLYDISIVDTYKGSYFLYKYVKEPINGREIPILPAKFVDTDNATGFVKSVPAHAPYDFIALRDINFWNNKIKPIPVISVNNFSDLPAKDIVERNGIRNQTDKQLEQISEEIYKIEFYNGVMRENALQFSGKRVMEIKESVKDWIISLGIGFKFYETSRKAVTRSGNKVIVAIVKGQWFLDYSNPEWKKKTHELIDSMKFYPPTYAKQFHDTVDWLRERPCVRKRGLGTKFPFEEGWIIESLSDSTIYPAFYTIIDKIREKKIKQEELDEKFFDYIFLGKYFDGCEKYNDIRESFKYWYPVDLRVSSIAHLSNHFTFYLFHHAAIFDQKNLPNGIMVLGMLISEGAKMSKSKGNVIPLAIITERYSADLFRLYIITNADFDTLLDWKEVEVKSLSKKLERFQQILEESIGINRDIELNDNDIYLLSVFKMRLKNCIENMEKYRFREAIIEIFFNFLNDIKDYEKMEGIEKRKILISKLMEIWLRSLSPVIPHIAEEYWHRLGHDNFISLEKYPKPEEIENVLKKEVKSKIQHDEMYVVLKRNYIENILKDIKNIIKVSGITPNKIYIYTANQRIRDLTKLVKNDREKAFKEAKDEFEINLLKQIIKQRIFDKDCLENEREIIEESKNYLERELNCKVIVDSDEDPGNKRRLALPCKPSIFIV